MLYPGGLCYKIYYAGIQTRERKKIYLKAIHFIEMIIERDYKDADTSI